MKICPFCGEEIQNEAKKCKHCGEWLNEKIEKDEKIEKSKKNKKPFLRQNIGMGIGALALLGGFGALGNGDKSGGDTAIFGVLLLIFCWCYQSAKKRIMGIYKKKNLMIFLEITFILISLFIVFGQSNLAQNLQNNPMPLLVLIAGLISYIYINFKK